MTFKFNHTDNPDIPHAQVIDNDTGEVLYSEFDKAAYDSLGVSSATMVKTLEERYNEYKANGRTGTADAAPVTETSSKTVGRGKDNGSGSKSKVRRKV